MSNLEVDMSDLRGFIDRLERAASGDFKRQLELWIDGLGQDFLRIVQDEIIRRKVLDTRLLLASFHKGGDSGLWELSDGGLTLEVGSTLEYAGYVNDGHWTNPKGVERRFVPGYWNGDRFIYDPAAEGGMVLKQHWVEGKHYFDSALTILENIFPGIFEAKLQEWLDNYF